MSTAQTALSLFSNCGAGDLGYARSGFDFRVMAELDPRRLEVALLNHPDSLGVSGDLRETVPAVFEAYRNGRRRVPLTLLAACPPCQGLSSARAGRGNEGDPDAGTRDSRNLLVEVVADAVHALEPRAVVIENVPAFFRRLVRPSGGGQPISAAHLLIRALGSRYRVFPFLTDLADYAVPQRRIRAFLTFLRVEEPGLESLQRRGLVPYPLPAETPHVTLDQALQTLGAKRLDAKSRGTAVDKGDPMHSIPVWGDDARYRMVSAIPPGSGGRAWDNDRCGRCGEENIALDRAVCPRCAQALPRPVIREHDGSYRLVKGFRRTSYSRMPPGKPAATVTTASGHVGSDLTIHPFENRVLSIRECAYLQTFPDSFEWGDALERWGATNVRAMIGEAVPPRFTELHGHAVRQALDDDLGNDLAGVSDPRVLKAMQLLSA